MSGSKVNTYGIGDANIQALMLSTDKLFKGFHKVSLTNYDSTSESQIAAGSVIECAGALYKFDSNESITGSPSDGTVYIRIVPGTTTCTAEYTNTAPTWSDAYQGWYGTGGAATYRYVEFVIKKSSTSWSKYKLEVKNKTCIKVGRESTDQSISTTSLTKIIFNYVSDDSKNEFDSVNSKFTALDSGYYLITGQIFTDAVGSGYVVGKLYKNGSIDGPVSYTWLFRTVGVTEGNAFSYLIFLSSGDYLEIFVESSADSSYSIMQQTRVNIIQV